MTGKPEYVLSGSYKAFVEWMRADPKVRARGTYLTAERAEALVASGAAKGTLHRLEGLGVLASEGSGGTLGGVQPRQQ